ncbi:MAG: CBS domain-containing protein, partial [Magnetospirillum sp.]
MKNSTLADIIRGPVLSIDADHGIDEALRVMGEARISCLLVTSGGAVCGIVTEKDLVRSYSGVASHARSRVADIMTPSPLTVPATLDHQTVGLEMAE